YLIARRTPQPASSRDVNRPVPAPIATGVATPAAELPQSAAEGGRLTGAPAPSAAAPAAALAPAIEGSRSPGAPPPRAVEGSQLTGAPGPPPQDRVHHHRGAGELRDPFRGRHRKKSPADPRG